MIPTDSESEARNDEDPAGLLAELGIDPRAPELVAAREDSHNYQQLVVALIDARNRAGMSQADVAQAMKTGQSAISRLECGLSDARYSTLQRYARAVGLLLNAQMEVPRPIAPPNTSIKFAPRWTVEVNPQQGVTRVVRTNGRR